MATVTSGLGRNFFRGLLSKADAFRLLDDGQLELDLVDAEYARRVLHTFDLLGDSMKNQLELELYDSRPGWALTCSHINDADWAEVCPSCRGSGVGAPRDTFYPHCIYCDSTGWVVAVSKPAGQTKGRSSWRKQRGPMRGR